MIEFPTTNLTISNEMKGKLPSLPFDKYKSAILGTPYELTINFIGEKKMQELNNNYRKIDKVTDILSFPLDEKTGEIFICEKYAEKKSASFGRTPENYLNFLIIHGLVHLKGYDHGPQMERTEVKFRKKFGI